MDCIGLCEGVHIAHRQITTQISIEFCILVIGLGLGLGLGQCQSDRGIRRFCVYDLCTRNLKNRKFYFLGVLMRRNLFVSNELC